MAKIIALAVLILFVAFMVWAHFILVNIHAIDGFATKWDGIYRQKSKDSMDVVAQAFVPDAKKKFCKIVKVIGFEHLRG